MVSLLGCRLVFKEWCVGSTDTQVVTASCPLSSPLVERQCFIQARRGKGPFGMWRKAESVEKYFFSMSPMSKESLIYISSILVPSEMCELFIILEYLEMAGVRWGRQVIRMSHCP